MQAFAVALVSLSNVVLECKEIKVHIVQTYLPAIIISLPSSFRDALVGEAEESPSITALISQDEMSWGYFSGSHVYAAPRSQ